MIAVRYRLALLARRSMHALPTVLGIVFLNFFLLQLAPGDAADVIAAERGAATEQSVVTLRREIGLDLPVLDQAAVYLYNLSRLDLGFSVRFGVPVTDVILERLPRTLALMISALVFATVVGVSLGVAMAAWERRLPDRILSTVVLLSYSFPSFWVSLLLIVLFSVKLKLLPSGGAGTIGSELTGFAALVDQLRYAVLPVTSLSLFYVAIYARITRRAMIETKEQDFVRTAKAKGVAPLRISIHHVLRNALIPILTLSSIHIGGILSGAVVIETVYGWPGLGRLAVESVMARDFKVLLGILLLSSLLVVLVNIAVDMVQAELDPRIKA